MTREEAIEYLTPIAESASLKTYAAALKLAISALRAQQIKPNKSWGCPVCMDHKVIAWDMCGDGIVIESDGRIHMLCGGDWDAEIRYCPNCGRPLTEEAWAELERKLKNA